MEFYVGHYYATVNDQTYYRVSGRTLALLSEVVPQDGAQNGGRHTSFWLCQDETGKQYPLLDDGRVGEWWGTTSLAFVNPATSVELVKEIEPDASVQTLFEPYPLMQVRYLTEEERLALQPPAPIQGQEPAWIVVSHLDLEFRVRGASKALASGKVPDLQAITAALEAICEAAGVELILCDRSKREDEDGIYREDGEEDDEDEEE